MVAAVEDLEADAISLDGRSPTNVGSLLVLGRAASVTGNWNAIFATMKAQLLD
jgi:hypothetical protein